MKQDGFLLTTKSRKHEDLEVEMAIKKQAPACKKQAFA